MDSLIRKLFAQRFVRFLIVGGVNTLFGYSAFAFLLFIGLHYSVASILGLILGILFNFKTTGSIVFNVHSNQLIPKFVAVYFVVYLVNVALLKIFHQQVSLYIVQAFLMLPMGFLAYSLHKVFVFNKK